MAPSPLRFAYRYWSVIFMAVCIGAVVFLPLVEEKGVLVEPTEADSVVAFLTSIPLIVAVSVTVAGLAWSLGYLGLTSLPDTEVMAMCWHLTNGTWWSCGCDSWSGLFKIMPRMRKLYLILDNKHGINFADQTKWSPWNPAQSALESVYWAETTVHVPLALLSFYLYATRSPRRYVVEAFLGGAQLVGCYGYYGPELLIWLNGFPTTWPDNKIIWWLGIGCVPIVWCLCPILLTARAFFMVDKEIKKKGGGGRKEKSY
ncbi:hypothetical protein TrCOL_g12344 [Triparma columacea]|uniref:EXPERA domain-containing protein n=1 Tax=Triparma columacea TaxID=722753 RepID=A0A9W7GLE5_9STRA|nr:hypothetical protein TrCOL_g12344 [Triparma columacea]